MAKQTHLNKLDAIRGFAAVYVVLHHFVHDLEFIPVPIKKILFSFGQEAVMFFFLLSGFVIYWSVNKSKELYFKSYFIKRFRRIYFPFTISIVVSIIVFYVDGKLAYDFSWQDLIGNFLMLQDFSGVKPGTWFPPFLANYPLWSLSYEWWFYMLFFPCYKLLPKNKNRIYFILFFSIASFVTYIAIPNQVALFFSYYIIWWSGIEAAEVFINEGRFTTQNMRPIIFSLLVMTTLTFIPVLGADKFQPGYYPFLIFRHFFAALITIVLGLLWYQKKLAYFNQTLGCFLKIAPISYGIYIFHYPILQQLNLNPYISNLWMIYLIKFAMIIGLSYVVEIKLQPLVNKWIR